MAIKFLNSINVTGSVSSSAGLTLSGLSAQNSEATALVVNGSNVVGTRELGSNAFTSTSYLAATGTAANSTLAGGLAVGTGRNNSANQIVRTQGNGYTEFGWINTTSGNTTATITDVYINTNDGYIRKATKSEFQSQMGIPTNAVLTTGAQTVAGIKTFSDDVKFSDNVGINGATSIDSPLDIAASTTSTNGLYQKWYYAANNESYTLSLKQTVTSGVVRYNFSMVNGGTSYNDVLVLDRGNVGIGTASPLHKLEVNGDTAIAAINGASTSGKPMLFVGESNAYGVGFRWDSSLSLDIVDFDNTTPTTTSGTKIGHFKIRDEEFYWKGKVGIGTTSPSQPLSVVSSYPQIRIQQSGQTPYFTFGSGTGFAVFDGVGTSGGLLDIRDDGTSRMRIDNAGNVGIGNTAPAQKLDVAGNMVFSQRLIANSNQYYVKLGVWSSASTYGIGMTNGFTYGALNNDYAMTFCMNSDSDRGFWWGYDGQSKSTGAMSLNMQGKLKINHSIGLGTVNPSATQGRIDASNDIVAFSTSDIRLKDNIKTIDKALDKVKKIQGVEFDWIEKEEVHGNSGHDIGVIAQEIEKVLPDVVTTRENGYKAVKYEKIVPLLIEAIKDLSKQVDGLKRLI